MSRPAKYNKEKMDAIKESIDHKYEILIVMYQIAEFYRNFNAYKFNHNNEYYDSMVLALNKLYEEIKKGNININYTFSRNIEGGILNLEKYKYYFSKLSKDSADYLKISFIKYLISSDTGCFLDGESLLSLLCYDSFQTSSNNELITKILDLNLNYKLNDSSFGRNNKFIKRITQKQEQTIPSNEFNNLEIICHFLRSDNIEGQYKIALINNMASKENIIFSIDQMYNNHNFKMENQPIYQKHLYHSILTELLNNNYIDEACRWLNYNRELLGAYDINLIKNILFNKINEIPMDNYDIMAENIKKIHDALKSIVINSKKLEEQLILLPLIEDIKIYYDSVKDKIKNDIIKTGTQKIKNK